MAATESGRPTVLVLRALHLGDLLVAVPALRALRRAYPGYQLVLATSPVLAPLAELTGVVDAVAPAAGPEAVAWAGPGPEVAVNLHGTGPQSHRALDALGPRTRIGFRADGWSGPEWATVARDHAHERERWCALLQAYGIPTDPEDVALHAPASVPHPGPAPVLVHPGARYGAKRWPAERFAVVAGALGDAGHRVLLTGSADERSLAVAVARGAGLPLTRVLAGRTSLRQLCGLVAGAGLVISGDTGIAHVAAAYRTPSVALFGPVSPAQWGPPVGGPHLALTVPDARHGDPFTDRPDPALLGVSVDDVLRAGRTLLSPVASR
ncbi:MAG: glycosyltransferase family 9 protein [Pseudonocardia sp.]